MDKRDNRPTDTLKFFTTQKVKESTWYWHTGYIIL